jgi:hypothetical protein
MFVKKKQAYDAKQVSGTDYLIFSNPIPAL